MHMLLCFHWYACMYDGYVLGGIESCFLNVFPSCFAYFSKGFCGLFRHYSPLDREEVAMYGGRALVGPQ